MYEDFLFLASLEYLILYHSLLKLFISNAEFQPCLLYLNFQISTCSKPRCRAISPNECVWFPFSEQTLQGVCIKRTNGTCNWYMDKSDSHTQHNVGQNGMAEMPGILEVREKATETLQWVLTSHKLGLPKCDTVSAFKYNMIIKATEIS